MTANMYKKTCGYKANGGGWTVWEEDSKLKNNTMNY